MRFLEPRMIRYERTNYGKEIRKKYESGEIQEKIGNMRQPMPRNDSLSNTLTSVLKDNLLLEPIGWTRKTEYINDWTRGEPTGMKFLDLFAGIGGFRLGMQQAGHQCVGFVEWDKFARKSYEAIHDTEGEWTANDIRNVTDHDLGLLRGKGIDIICGGFPCQAFSVAGKRGGFNDTRGTLFFEIARFAQQIKPRFLFLENVKGLLSHDQGNTFGTILNTLDELGYDAEWQVLNSKDFGVPQNRERVFIIGHLRGTSGRKVFPIGESVKVPSEEWMETTACISALTATDYKGPSKQRPNLVVPVGMKQVGQLYGTDKEPNPQARRIYSGEGIPPTLDTCSGGNRMPKVAIPVLTPDRAEKRQNGRMFKEDGEPMFTLTAQDRHGIMLTRHEIKKITDISHYLMARRNEN
jgi:DNA (cytosine-5)-methyltransferase 1